MNSQPKNPHSARKNPHHGQLLGISQFNIENNKSKILGEPTIPKKGHQSDDYEGPVDPVTRLRHGVGMYRYPNKYFVYKGNYKEGIKFGEGTLILGDGTVIKGMFQNDQLSGEAQIQYSDGSTYKGNLKNGQKSGYGIYKSKYEQYEGEYIENRKSGKGVYQTKSIVISGTFENNRPHGKQISIKKYNYEYHGECKNGVKDGMGIEVSSYLDDNYQYEGHFSNDRFQGIGIYTKCTQAGYKYEGQFKNGQPSLYPNQFRISLATQSQSQQLPAPQNYTIITTDQNILAPIQYQLEIQNRLYFIIELCYQAPEIVDPVQPSEEQIEKMIKNWQNENKKNKNAPPMPNFRLPRMIKPELVVVKQELERRVQVRLSKNQGMQTREIVKIDYRDNIKKAKQRNQQIKAENAKKAQEEVPKKGGKAPAKNQIQLKVNCFNEPIHQNQKCIAITSQKGRAELHQLQFPDDFPPGTYHLLFQSPFTLFGQVQVIKKPINIKWKTIAKKK